MASINIVMSSNVSCIDDDDVDDDDDDVTFDVLVKLLTYNSSTITSS